MTDEQIIELVARAIFSAEGKTHLDDERMFQPVKWEELDDDDYQCVRGGYRSQARAAISALRSAGMAVVPRDIRRSFYYPIEMPVTKDGYGPAKVGLDADRIIYEVWDRLLVSHSSHDNLPDAINQAMALNDGAMINTAEGKTE